MYHPHWLTDCRVYICEWVQVKQAEAIYSRFELQRKTNKKKKEKKKRKFPVWIIK